MRGKGDVSRLPRWAQDELRILAANLADAQKRIRSFGDKHNTRIIVGPHREPPIGISADETVRFYLDGEGTHIDIHMNGAELQAMISGPRTYSLFVIPSSSNVVKLRAGNYHQ